MKYPADSGGFALVETILALALLGMISLPMARLMGLQQRYLDDAGETFSRDREVFSFFNSLETELALMKYPWWGPFPVVETSPGLIRVTWRQNGRLRIMTMEGNCDTWILEVDDNPGQELTLDNLEFKPLLRGNLFCGIQAILGRDILHFYTSSQPFSPVIPENRLSQEVSR
jgi:hypothetical protein